MNKKSLAVLAGVFAVFIAAYFVITKFAYKPKVIQPLKDVETASISRVYVARHNEEFTFEKKDNRWIVKEHEKFVVDQESFGEALMSLRELEIKDVISENLEKFDRFDVSEESGTLIKVYAVSRGAENNVLDIILGKNTQNYLNYFVKLTDENKVRLSSGLNKYSFENPKTSWRNKVITQFDKEAFIAAEINIGKLKYEITRLADEFLFNGKQAERDKAENFIHSVSSIRAYEYADDDTDLKKAGIEPKPKISVKIQSAEGDYEIKIGNPDESQSKYYAVKANDPTIYFFGKHIIDKIEESIEQLK